MTWDRWLGVVASVIGLAVALGSDFGPIILVVAIVAVVLAIVVGAVVLAIVVRRQHVAYDRPPDQLRYTPPPSSHRIRAMGMPEVFQTRYRQFYPEFRNHPTRRRRPMWRRNKSMAVPRISSYGRGDSLPAPCTVPPYPGARLRIPGRATL